MHRGCINGASLNIDTKVGMGNSDQKIAHTGERKEVSLKIETVVIKGIINP